MNVYRQKKILLVYALHILRMHNVNSTRNLVIAHVHFELSVRVLFISNVCLIIHNEKPLLICHHIAYKTCGQKDRMFAVYLSLRPPDCAIVMII